MSLGQLADYQIVASQSAIDSISTAPVLVGARDLSVDHLWSPSLPARPQPVTPEADSIEAIVAAMMVIGPAPSRAYRVAKRALDIAVAGSGLLALAPLMLLIGMLVRLDSPGPALFVQNRVGRGGRAFRLLKFRTMVDGAGLLLGEGPHKRQDDRRVTRLGRILRKTSLDELPQLINVLLGQMSLVGPRPEILELVPLRYQTWQYRRFMVPQGITGWWQVTGRGDKLLYEHVEDDLFYIERASFWFDLKILLKTPLAIVRGVGAF